MKAIRLFSVQALVVFSAIALFSCSRPQEEKKGGSEVLDRIRKTGVLKVGTDFVGTPFAFYDEEGNPVGFEVELLQAIADEMGVKTEWVKIPFGIDNFVKALNEGEADVIVESVSLTAERREKLDFSSPYFTSGQAVVLRSGEKVPDNFDLKLLKGKKIGVEEGTTGARFARNNTAGDVVEFETSEDQIDALLSGEVYAIISDILSTQTTNWPLWKKLKVVLKNLTHEEYGLAVKKGETALVRRLDAILRKFKEDPIEGVYARLYRKWFY